MRYKEIINEGERQLPVFKQGDLVIDKMDVKFRQDYDMRPEEAQVYTYVEPVPGEGWSRLEDENGDEVEIETHRLQHYQVPAANTSELSESYYDSNSWTILPATMALYGKRTMPLVNAADHWGRGTVYICKKSGEDRFLFVVSSGKLGDYSKVGSVHPAYHDQSRAYKGDYHVLNIVEINDGQIVDKVNDIGLNAKGSVAVFK